MGEGINLSRCVHKKCGEKELIDYGGYVWCDRCQEIAEPEDILGEEEHSSNFHLWRGDLERNDKEEE